MPKAMKASELGLEPHWKVRVVVPGALLHLASRTAPDLIFQHDGRLSLVVADWITDGEYGDTPGFVHWSEATAITWRYSP